MRKFWKRDFCRHTAFTLAEMMVVMLILSIVLAAMAPVMTTRNKSDYSSPWRYSTNGSDAYFAGNAVSNQIAMLGQHEVGTGENDARLIIRTASDSGWSHLLFKTGDEIVGRLYLDKKNLFLSSQHNAPFGEYNTAFGIGALKAISADAKHNTALGNNAMSQLTSGTFNVAVGDYSLNQESTGDGNTAVGYNSLRDGAGNNNTAIGYQANFKNVAPALSVSNSVAIGASSQSFADGATAIGTSSTAVGDGSIALGYSSQTGDSGGNYGDYSIAIGYDASAYGTSSSSSDDYKNSSIAIGPKVTTSSNNSIAIGGPGLEPEYGIEVQNTEASADKSIAIGYGAQSTSTSGSGIAIGYYAVSPMENSIAIGFFTEISGGDDHFVNDSNIAIGNKAMSIKGGRSVALGYSAISMGDSALALGSVARAQGDHDVSVGDWAGYLSGGTENDTQGYNVSIGYKAGYNVRGSNNISIGRQAGDRGNESDLYFKNNTISIGNKALSESDHAISIGNEAVSQSLNSITIGTGSTCKGENSVCIGNGVVGGDYPTNVGAPESPDHVIHLGTSSDTVYIPGNLVVMGNTLLGGTPDRRTVIREKGEGTSFLQIWGTGQGSTNYIKTHSSRFEGPIDIGPFTIHKYSDRRLKYVGKENTSGLDKIRQLKVFNYTFKKDEKKTPHVGVIAQDLQKVFPDAVKKGVDGFLTIRMEDMFYAVINAIKELDAKYQAQEKRINELEQRIERLESKLN